MKYIKYIVFCLIAVGPAYYLSAEDSKAKPAPVVQAERQVVERQQLQSTEPRYDLDFPGGTPAELVAAIQKASGMPLNAVIYREDANRQLPPLKMSQVNTAELFKALFEGSQRRQTLGCYQYSERFGFQTIGRTDSVAVWFFVYSSDQVPTKDCRFYLLTEYLDQGLTVDDISTAIQTAWKLRGDNPMPTLNFHKETKLLIAVGYSRQLDTIDDVLKALRPKFKKAAEPEKQEPPQPQQGVVKPKA